MTFQRSMRGICAMSMDSISFRHWLQVIFYYRFSLSVQHAPATGNQSGSSAIEPMIAERVQDQKGAGGGLAGLEHFTRGALQHQLPEPLPIFSVLQLGDHLGDLGEV